MKRLLIVLGCVVAVLLLAAVLIPLFINVDSFRPELEKKISSALGRQVKIGKLDASIFSGGAEAKEITIADDPAFSSRPFLQASSLKVGLKLLPLIFSRQINVTSLTVQKPEIALIKNAAGKWNYSTLGASHEKAPEKSTDTKAPDFSVEKFQIASGKVTVAQGKNGKQAVYQNVDLVARNISTTSAIPFTISAELPGGGSMGMQGQLGPLDPSGPSKSPLDATVTLKKADLAATGFVDPSSGLAGTLDFDGKVHSDGRKVHSEGKAQANGLRVVKGGQPAKQPVVLDYTSDYQLEREAGTLDATLHAGKSATKASGSIKAQGEEQITDLKLQGKDMPVNDVAELLPAFGVVLPAGTSLQGGSINMDMTAQGPLDRLVINGPLNISGTRLSGYNLGSKLGAITALTGGKSTPDTLIQTLSSALRVSPEGIKADNIVLDVPSLGNVTGNGVIGADNSLDFKMVLKLSGNAGNLLGGLTGASMSGSQSKGLPFLIQGKTSNPVFLPAVGNTLKEGLRDTLLGGKGGQGDAQKNGLQGVLGGLLNKKKKP